MTHPGRFRREARAKGRVGIVEKWVCWLVASSRGGREDGGGERHFSAVRQSRLLCVGVGFVCGNRARGTKGGGAVRMSRGWWVFLHFCCFFSFFLCICLVCDD